MNTAEEMKQNVTDYKNGENKRLEEQKVICYNKALDYYNNELFPKIKKLSKEGISKIIIRSKREGIHTFTDEYIFGKMLEEILSDNGFKYSTEQHSSWNTQWYFNISWE